MILDGESVSGIGTSWTEVVPAVAAGKKSGVTSCVLSNITAGSITVSARVTRNGGSPISYIVKDAPLPVGSSLEIIINRPINLNEGDKIEVQSNTAASVDATASFVEV